MFTACSSKAIIPFVLYRGRDYVLLNNSLIYIYTTSCQNLSILNERKAFYIWFVLQFRCRIFCIYCGIIERWRVPPISVSDTIVLEVIYWCYIDSLVFTKICLYVLPLRVYSICPSIWLPPVSPWTRMRKIIFNA